MQAAPRAIGWDLDHTLVGFMPAAHDRFAPAPQSAVGPGVLNALGARPGIGQALERLSRRGYLHYITTTGTRDYAEQVLTATGLRHHFAGIFEGRAIDLGAGKRYRPLAQTLGLSDDEARRRIVVIGDQTFDQPADFGGLVFIHEPDGFRHQGTVVETVIAALEDAAGQDFNAGFHALHVRARQGRQTLPALGNGYATVFPPALPSTSKRATRTSRADGLASPISPSQPCAFFQARPDRSLTLSACDSLIPGSQSPDPPARERPYVKGPLAIKA